MSAASRSHGRERCRAVAFMLGAVMLAACGSNQSILQAGNDAPATTSPAGTDGTATQPTVAGQTTLPPPSTQPATTLPQALDLLPPCDTRGLDAASANGPVELLFWHAMSNELGRELERLADEYNSIQTRVHVSTEFQGGYAQTIDKYLQSNTSNRPDLVQMPEYTVQLMVDTKSNVPMQACMENSGFDASALLPSALDAYATGGVQWGMPFNMSNPVLYYNKKIFRDAGLDDARPPLTLEEVAEYGRIIQQSGAAAYGLALESSPDGGGGWFLEQWLAKQGEFYSDNANGRSAPSTRVLFDGPAGVALGTQLQGLVVDGGAIYVGENPSGQDAFLKMADAKQPAAMTIATSAGLGPVLGFIEGGIIPGIGPDDLGVGPLPSVTGAPGVLVGGASLWITDGRGTDKAAAAWDFTNWLVSAEIQSQWAAATGYVPVNVGAPEIEPLRTVYTNDPRFEVAYDQVLATPQVATSRGPVIGPLREVRVTAAGAIAQILSGTDPATALSDAAATANALVADYNARRPS